MYDLLFHSKILHSLMMSDLYFFDIISIFGLKEQKRIKTDFKKFVSNSSESAAL